MAPTIHTSLISPVPTDDHERSIFTHLLYNTSRKDGPDHIGGFPGETPAFIDAVSGATITRVRFKKLALSFAYGLRNHPSLVFPPNYVVGGQTTPTPIVRGDTVMIFAPNSIMYPVMLYGAVAAGVKTTLANTAYLPRELAWQWTDSGARIVCVDEELVPVARQMFQLVGIPAEEGEKRMVVVGKGMDWVRGVFKEKTSSQALTYWEELLAVGALDKEECFDGRYSDDTTFLCYSSGTTGKPKGVETTHANLTTMLDIARPTFPRLYFGRDAVLTIPPFFHIYGVTMLLLFMLHNGIPMIVQPRFDPVAFCANIQRFKITVALVVPPVLVALSRHPAVEKYDLSTLRFCLSAAAPLGSGLIKQVMVRLNSLRRGKPGPGFVIVQGYGLTETSPVTHLCPEFIESKAGSIGVLLPNLKARLVKDEEGKIDALPGEPGELWVKGRTVMKGYLNNGAATRHTISPDGWFQTGDIAVVDAEGYYWIVDRKKELIKYKGFQVPPAELESVLLTHPEIADVAVIGIDDPIENTELPRAYIVHASPESVNTDAAKAECGKQICKWMESKVARHKYLRGGVEVIQVIPKSASGKILRRELRDRAKQPTPARL